MSIRSSSLVDGSVTDLGVAFSGSLGIDNVYATSDGWIINGMGYSQLEDGDHRRLDPDTAASARW